MGVEIWRSPAGLRECFQLDIMELVLSDMRRHEACWSFATAARAMLLSARHFRSTDREDLLEEIQDCWLSKPICTSVVIIFWQRYLCRLAEAANRSESELILHWMPLKADRVLPGELINVMIESGWKPVRKCPQHALQRHSL